MRSLDEGNSTSAPSGHTYINMSRTENIGELPIFTQVVIIASIVIMSLLAAIPVIGIIYGCIRKEKILRNVETHRRQRIEAFLREANTTPEEVNVSSWQRAIRNVPYDQVDNILSRLMFVFTWVSNMNQEKNVDKITGEDVDDKPTLESSENANYCAICISHFEDNDEVVQSMSNDIEGKENIEHKMNLCVHRFHKKCMIEWLLLSKEPNCPCCRREYLDKDRMMEEGLFVEDTTEEFRSGDGDGEVGTIDRVETISNGGEQMESAGTGVGIA